MQKTYLLLRRARDNAGLTQAELGRKMGLSRDTIARLETNIQKVKLEHLQEYSKHCDVPIKEFIMPDQGHEKRFIYMLRAQTSGAFTQEIQQKFEQWYSHYNGLLKQKVGEIDHVGQLRRDYLNLSDIHDDGEATAEWLRERWDLGNMPVMDVVDLLEENGIMITGFNFASDKIFGIAGREEAESRFGIAVNIGDNVPIERQRFSIIHELAHIISDTRHTVPSRIGRGRKKDSKEQFADSFASAFLVPAEGLKRRLQIIGNPGRVSDGVLFYLKRHFRVSYMVILYRLKDIGILTQDQLRRNFSNARYKWGKMEPQPLTEPLHFEREAVLSRAH